MASCMASPQQMNDDLFVKPLRESEHRERITQAHIIGPEEGRETICPVCFHLVVNPVETSKCGHHFCASCFTEVQKKKDVEEETEGEDSETSCKVTDKSGAETDEDEDNDNDKEKDNEEPRCPICCTPTTAAPSPFFERHFVSNLQVKCLECGWCGSVNSFKVHLQDSNGCPKEVLECSCGFRGGRSLVKLHARDTCPDRVVECEHCKEGHKAGLMSEHHLICELFPVECPSCKLSLTRGKLNAHDAVCDEKGLYRRGRANKEVKAKVGGEDE